MLSHFKRIPNWSFFALFFIFIVLILVANETLFNYLSAERIQHVENIDTSSDPVWVTSWHLFVLLDIAIFLIFGALVYYKKLSAKIYESKHIHAIGGAIYAKNPKLLLNSVVKASKDHTLEKEPHFTASLLGVSNESQNIFVMFEALINQDLNVSEEIVKQQFVKLSNNITKISLKKLKSGGYTLTVIGLSVLDLDNINRNLFELISAAISGDTEQKADIKIGYCNYAQDADQVMVYQLAQSALMVSKSSKWLNTYKFSYNQTQIQLSNLSPDEINHYIKKKCFLLLFQPIFSLTNGEILQHEALLRVRHKTLGLLNAAQLIPSIQSKEQIELLDKAIVEQVIKVIKSEVVYHYVSINLHQINWFNSDFCDWLLVMFKDPKVSKSILLEIAEVDLLTADPQLQDIFKKLNALGVKIILDKVEGAILNSALLSHFKIHAVKLDYAMIHDINLDINKQQQIKNIIQLTKEHKIPVFAVGVEQKCELDILNNLGVYGAQGHYFSEPLQELSAFSNTSF